MVLARTLRCPVKWGSRISPDGISKESAAGIKGGILIGRRLEEILRSREIRMPKSEASASGSEGVDEGVWQEFELKCEELHTELDKTNPNPTACDCLLEAMDEIWRSSYKVRERIAKEVLNESRTIEGNLATGKTTLTTTMERDAKRRGFTARQLPEFGFESWLGPVADSLRKNEENKRKGNGQEGEPDRSFIFAFQLKMLSSCAWNMNNARVRARDPENPQVIITDRSMYGNHVFSRAQHELGNLTEDMYKLYLQEYDHFMSSMAIKDDDQCIVYLYTGPQMCLDNVKVRGREGEEGYRLEYLDLLDRIYLSQFMAMYFSGKYNTMLIDYTNFTNSEDLLDNLSGGRGTVFTENIGLYYQMWLHKHFNKHARPLLNLRIRDFSDIGHMMHVFETIGRSKRRDFIQRLTIRNIIRNAGIIDLKMLDPLLISRPPASPVPTLSSSSSTSTNGSPKPF